MSITFICVGVPGVSPSKKVVEIDSITQLRLGSFLLRCLPELAGPQLNETSLSENILRGGYAILVNGRNASQVDGMATFITEGDTIVVTAPVVGG